MGPEDQVVRYADIAGASVAWSAVGSGPPAVVGGWWSSHLVHDWADARFRRYVGRLAQHRTVLRYDRPGCGASDRSAAPPATLEEEYAVLRGLVDTLESERVDLVGGSSGCAVASLFASRHLDTTRSLVLYGGYLRGADIASPTARTAMVSMVEQHWGLGSRVLADVFVPGADAEERERFAALQRRSATPEGAAAGLRTAYSFDCSGHVSAIRVPTLVLHRRGDRAIPFALGAELAERIPDATFIALEGVDHYPWRGDQDAVADAVIRFWGGVVPRRPAPAPSGSLSAREREVLALVARGCTDAEIASQLVLSTHTVHRHVANIRTKLGVPTRAAAAAWATGHGIL